LDFFDLIDDDDSLAAVVTGILHLLLEQGA